MLSLGTAQKNGLLERRFGKHDSEESAACRRHDLVSGAVDGIGMKRRILDSESDAAHVFPPRAGPFRLPTEKVLITYSLIS